MKNILSNYVYVTSLVTVFLFLHLTAFAQTRSISGTVKDANNGETLPGAAVVLKGTLTGTQTDINGEFKINASVGDSLVFSFVGKKSVTEVVGVRNVLEILLYDDENLIEEVVVQAFGRVKKTSVATSITSVNVKDLRVPASNFTQALAGNVAGIISFQTSGEPGADNAQFFVRGVTSFGYAKGPLILIDGFESSTDDLARLQVDDIESFSVMKDAAAAVMYGARSANGIISVVTKGGREGKARINFRFDANMAFPTRKIEFLDGVQYMRLYNEAQMTRNPLLPPFYSEQKILATSRGEYPMIYPNVDWYGDMFNKSTWNEKANLSVSGGGQVATYYIAAGFEHETGLLKVDKRNNFNSNINITRTHLRSNVTFKLTKTTTLDTRLSARFERYNGPFQEVKWIYQYIMMSNPVDFPAVYEPDEANKYTDHVLFGSIINAQGWKVNPFASMVRGYEDRYNSKIIAQATLTQELDFITKGLRISAKASADNDNRYSSLRAFNPYYYALQTFNQITGDYTLFPINQYSGSSYLGDVDPIRDAGAKFYFEGILSWNRSFGVHNTGVQIVGTRQENLYGGGSTSMYETLPEKTVVIAGRANYNYAERYFFDFSFGYNGSEKFTGDKQFGFFPAVAGAWMLSNEDFFQSVKGIIPMMKLKASWGIAGNDAIGGRNERFKFLSQLRIPSSGDSPLTNGYRWGDTFMDSYGGYQVLRYANPEITWEASKKYNVGMEINLFKNESVRIEFDVFKELRSNIYWSRDNYPASSGLEASLAGNVGKVNAKGIDGSINVEQQFTRDLWMQGRANFTYGRNEIIEIDEKAFPDLYLRRKGYPVDQEWGLIAERLFVDEAEINNSPHQDFGEYMAGDIKYKDVNGDGVVNDNDRVAMGYPTKPEMQIGFGLSFGYKRFDFSFFLQGNARVSMFINPGVGGGDQGEQGIAPFVAYRNALPIVARDYWSETAPNPHAFWPRLSTTPIDNNMRQSSWWMRDVSFLRLKNIEIGYNIPGWDKISMSNLRFYVILDNMYVWSKFKLWDPEMGKSGLGYPPNRRINVGIKMDF